ncbi:MAG: NrfD/PsrC family molybdoenzyme membrane anchor subunit [Longimicrobiales bacterium]
MNPNANGQMQKEWGWWIAVYLFLGGIGGGAYTIGAFNWLVGGTAEGSTTVSLWIGFPALAIGSLCLLADLGSPAKAVLAGKRPGTSWIARGFWIISIFMVLAFLHFVLHLFTDATRLDGGRALLNVIAVLGMVFAVGTMAYTGVLLSASKGIPFWRSGVVPVVFVVSALVTGHFTIMLGIALTSGIGAIPDPLRIMAFEAAALVALEVLAIVFFLQAAFRLPDPRESAERILRNRMFVVGYFLLGLAVPLALMVLVYRTVAPGDAATTLALVGIGSVLGLVGGVILRQAILASGALPTLNMGGFEFRRIARPKDPKPASGLMPPV